MTFKVDHKNAITLLLALLKRSLFFFFFWLRWVFVAAHGLSLDAVSGGYSSLQCAGFSLRWLLLLRNTGSRHAGFSGCGLQALELRFSCSTACGIFPDQGSNPCPLHWQADSQPLLHQGNPKCSLLKASYHIGKKPKPAIMKRPHREVMCKCFSQRLTA